MSPRRVLALVAALAARVPLVEVDGTDSLDAVQDAIAEGLAALARTA